MSREHIIPLSTQATGLLEDLAKRERNIVPDNLVFTSLSSKKRPYCISAPLLAIRRMGYSTAELSIHGFRSSFSTLSMESELWDAELIEMCLAHVQQNKVRAAYNRSRRLEERSKLMQWWPDSLDEWETKEVSKDERSILKLPFPFGIGGFSFKTSSGI